MSYLLLLLGFVLLIKGADFFVEGSSNIAKFFKIPSVIIGLTLVAFGTSAPEAAVSITAAFNHSADLSVSNIIGSNIFNLLIVLGLTATFKDVITKKEIISKDYKLSIFASLLVLVLVLVNYFLRDTLILSRIDGFILLGVLGYYLFTLLKNVDTSKKEIIYKKFSVKDIFYVIGGLVAIIYGG